jgi:hypothetical protein
MNSEYFVTSRDQPSGDVLSDEPSRAQKRHLHMRRPPGETYASWVGLVLRCSGTVPAA